MHQALQTTLPQMLLVMCVMKMKMPIFLCIACVQVVSIAMTPTMFLCVEGHNNCLSSDRAMVPQTWDDTGENGERIHCHVGMQLQLHS